VTSAACAALLLRAYLASGARLLLWSTICFALLAVNNTLLFIDLAVVTEIDLSVWRAATGLAGLLALLYGLIYDRQPGRR
jgi:hypothetical protein